MPTRKRTILFEFVLVAASAALACWGAPAVAQKAPTVITQFSFGAGSSTLVASQGLRQLVNANSTKVRVEVQPGRGLQNLMYWQRRPEKRAALFVDMTSEDAQYPKPSAGLKPVLALFPFSASALITSDPAIRSIRDVEGKAVDLGGVQRNASGLLMIEAMKRAGVDISKVDLSKQTATQSARADQIADGITQVAQFGMIAKRMVAPAFRKLMLQKRLYFVDFTKEAVEPLAPATVPYAVCPGVVQKQYKLDYDPNQGRKVYFTYAVPSTWAGTEVPESVVYEYVSTVIKKRAEIKNYLPRFGRLIAGQMGHVPLKQAEFHPGARRAYEEAGLTYGLEGMAKWEAAQKNICQ